VDLVSTTSQLDGKLITNLSGVKLDKDNRAVYEGSPTSFQHFMNFGSLTAKI